MRSRISPIEALVTLPRLEDVQERRANWRQAIAALGQAVRIEGPSLLDGIEPALLLRSIQVALESSLADDLDWLEPWKSAVALYELTSVLPAGPERRELGRRVFFRIYEGTASTFGAVAARMALGAARSLDTPSLRARVALLFELPTGTSVNAPLLALTLASRRETCDRWIARPSMGALPARRLAARILEFACREAVMRSQQGDSYPRQLLLGPQLQPVFRRLLADREPLVWRHAAAARGLLATVDGSVRQEVELALDPGLSPTEWRRAAVSLVALIAGDAQTALSQCRRLLTSEIGVADPGIAAAMVGGLPSVIESEPEAAEQLLEILAGTRRFDVAEATGALLQELTNRAFGQRAQAVLRQVVAGHRNPSFPAGFGLCDRVLRQLERGPVDHGLMGGLRQALVAYDTTGARAAHDAAVATVVAAHELAAELERNQNSIDPEVMARNLAELQDLDSSCLESSALADLMLLNRRPGDTDATVPLVERLYHRVGRWILNVEGQISHEELSHGDVLAKQRRLRALLHLVDAETIQGDAEDSGNRVRVRLRQAAKVLLAQLASGPDGTVHRILCATLARTFDAAVREGVAEPSDLFLVVARHLTDREGVAAISEASTNPEVGAPLSAYAAFLDHSGNSDDHAPDSSSLSADEVLIARRVVRLSQAAGAGGSYRAEALRQLLLRLGRALEGIAGARGLSELADRNRSGMDWIRELEASSAALRELVNGAARRVLDDDTAGAFAVTTDVASLSVLVERAISEGVPPNARQIALASSELTVDLPESLASAISAICARLDGLPIAGGSDVYAIPLEKRRAPLPDWLLPRRTVGAFYVVRALGAGGVSSVFVARRLEERNDPRAPLFALKVPEYDPTTARSLSEQEFLALFRDEAGALLSLPHHPNLARFVTFDLAARPKPILVMELISGFGLDRLVRSRSLTVERTFRYLVGILDGLAAMHAAGIGHLDIKPSNIILRDGEVPVLVDFGLSGRKVRPGCGTLDYCAPEILGVTPDPQAVTAAAADIYAFGSMAFEVLAAQPLLDGVDEMALVSQHVSHDGWPDKLARLGRIVQYAELTVILAACLRHDPRARPTALEVRDALTPIATRLAAAEWPLSLERNASQRPRSA